MNHLTSSFNSHLCAFASSRLLPSCFLLLASSFFLLFLSAKPTDSPKPPDLGPNANLNGHRPFPDTDLWNKDISADPVDPSSDILIRSIGLDKPLHPDFGTVYNNAPNGIPYIVVPGHQPKVPIHFTEYGEESDRGPYPVPMDAPIEGGPKSDGDRHVLVIDRDHWLLYELYHAFPMPNGKGWKAGSGAIFDLKKGASRPKGITSADAAGLPIFPGLVRYDEVSAGQINHALRFTVTKTRKIYIPPATHFASNSNDPRLPPMGLRVRLKANYDISKFPASTRVILTALKKYGMIVADNGGDWYLSGAPDPKWNDDDLHTLTQIKGRDFEVVKMNR